jgi:flagellar basal-body rod protein FlgB
MFYNASDFKALEAGSQMAWMQQQISLQNIANAETPGYKSKNLTFDSVLKDAADGTKKLSSVSARVSESDAISNRSDGNNVDTEAESLALYRSYAQYSALLSKVKSDFDQYNYVLNCGMK